MNFRFLYFICLLLTFSGCAKEANYFDYFNIKTDLIASLSQNVNENGSFPVIIVSTIDSINCKNSEINLNQKIVNNNTEISIEGLIKNNVCEAGKSKPTGIGNLPNSNETRTIALILENTIVSEGTLSSSDKSLELNLETPKGLVVENSNINKIGPNTAWGVLNTNDLNLKKEFQDILNKNKIGSFIPESGNYGLFKLESNIITEFSDSKISSPLTGTNTYFYVQYLNWENFLADLKKFKQAHPSVILKVRNFIDKTL
jgi:hypothetical protein